VPADFVEAYERLAGNITHLAEHYAPCDRGTVRGWRDELGLEPLELAGISINPRGGVSKRYKPIGDPVPFIAPPFLPGDWTTPKRPKPKVGSPRGWAIFNDIHCPEHDEDLIAAACAWLADEQPTDGILNGDIVNFDAVSRYKTNPYKTVETINACLKAACNVLWRIVTASPGTRWKLGPGNHENRLPDWIMAKAPEFWGVRPGGDEAFDEWHSLRNLLLLDKFGIELHPNPYPDADWAITPKFVVTHGDHVRSKSGNSAHAALDKSDHSFAQGHDHRLAQVFRTKWKPDGTPAVHVGVQAGCMARVDATGLGYAKKPDWQQGFAYVTTWPDGLFSAQLAVFVDGALMIGDKRY
jgi:hypothetical protein